MYPATCRTISSTSRARRVLATLLSLGLAFPLAPTVTAQAVAGAVTSDARTQLDHVAQLLVPSEYDVAALGLELADGTPEDIAAWVVENLTFEVYRGLLRGPQGTLVAKAGNALDQSVLLATLLGAAGYEARVALGELADADALKLVLSMFERQAVPASGSQRAVLAAESVSRLASVTGVDEGTATAAVELARSMELEELPAFRDAVAVTQSLLGGMGGTSPSDATALLTAEAKEYAWVEYRQGADDWTAAHPAWPATAAPPAVLVEQVIDDSVPAELMHHLRIEMTIERKRGNDFETEQIMTPWQRPVANLLGHALVVGNSVLGGSGPTDLATLGADAMDAAFYVPVLNGALAPGATAFDLKGNLVPPDVAMSGMAGVFQTTASRLGDAVGMLGAMGSDEPVEEVFALTSQWIDFVLVAPGGGETRHRRVVFDRRAPDVRAAGGGQLLDEAVLLENLISTYVVMATGGTVTPAYVASRLQEQAEFHLDVLDALSSLNVDGTPGAEGSALLEQLADYVPKDHLRLFAASDAIDQALTGVAYRAEPSLIALVGTVTPTEQARASTGVDIIANGKRTLLLVDGAVGYDVEGGVLAGAWDTVVERDFVAASGQAGSGAARAVRPPAWALVNDDEGLAAAGVPDRALTAVRNDLRSGYAVLVPIADEDKVSATSPAEWAYWRVDLVTGETLGMNWAGRGGAMAEFVVGLQVGLTVNASLAVPGLIMCHNSGAPWQCYCDVIASGVILSLAGALFGAFIGGQAVLVYALVDVGIVAPVTTVFWTPPVCSALIARPGRLDLASSRGTYCWAA